MFNIRWLVMMYFVAYGMFDVSLTQTLPFFDFPLRSVHGYKL